MSESKPFWAQCWHSEYTEPDEDGKALCTACGAVTQARLTRALMVDTFEMMRRQGYHKMACVETDVGWCCVPGCPTLARKQRA